MDLASFERFYHTHYSKLLSMASQVLCDDEAARDVVADAFEYAWTHFNEIPEPRLAGHLVMWVRSRCIDQLRHRQVHEKMPIIRMAS